MSNMSINAGKIDSKSTSEVIIQKNNEETSTQKETSYLRTAGKIAAVILAVGVTAAVIGYAHQQDRNNVIEHSKQTCQMQFEQSEFNPESFDNLKREYKFLDFKNFEFNPKNLVPQEVQRTFRNLVDTIDTTASIMPYIPQIAVGVVVLATLTGFGNMVLSCGRMIRGTN